MSGSLPRSWILAIVLGGSFFGFCSTGLAQGFGLGPGGALSDPFTFYYGVYLPSQAAQAMRPRPMDTINAATAQRQAIAAGQRRSLYNPASPYAEEEFDPLSRYSDKAGAARQSRAYRFVQDPSNSDGNGPAAYYNRAAQYYPGMREGRAANANVYQRRSGRGGGMRGMGGMGGGMGGMGGMGGGMGGMGGMGMGGMGMPR